MSLKSSIWAGLLLGALAVNALAQTMLKDAYKPFFRIGAALNPGQFNETNALGATLVKTQFDSITPENILKWGLVHPRPDAYAFEASDRFVAFGEKNGMFIVGHCLVWHSQTPAWVFQDDKGAPLDREGLLKRMRDHISTVVGRYKGRIHGWDVVNEALNEDGTLRQSQWMKIIGEDYLAKAFQFAHEADPQAELYYNDYSLEGNEAKRKGAVELIKKLKAQGVAITAAGLQGHISLDSPSLQQIDQAIAAFKALGVKVAITELDVDVLPATNRGMSADVGQTAQAQAGANPYTGGLPDAVVQTQTKRYADLFGVFLKYRGTLTRVTFWGVTDGDSWKNNFPVRGRTNYPLLFDRQGAPKPSVDALIRAAKAISGTR
jgi:endo-1,4-beta-xylanase